MQRIIDFIKSNGEQSFSFPGTVIASKCNDSYWCHFIEKGVAIIYSDIHSRPSGMVNGPYVVGLNQIMYPEEGLTLKMIHSSIVYSISVKSLSDMICQNNLWSVLVCHLSEMVYELHSKTHKRKKVDVVSVVYSTLQSLQKESEEVRLAHTATDYVSGITGLSSSTVARVLDTLKKERSVDVYNGLLIRLHERAETSR